MDRRADDRGHRREATRNAVIGCPEKKFKASLRSEHLLAKIAVIDPELAVGGAAAGDRRQRIGRAVPIDRVVHVESS